MIEISKCIICDSHKFSMITNRGMYFSGEKVVECRNCGMIHLSPRMSIHELEKFYVKNQFSKKFRGNTVPNELIITAREKRAVKKMSLIQNYLNLVSEGPILEIGCSSGYLLNKLQNKGFKVYGIDPSDGFIRYARYIYKLNVVSGMFPSDVPDEWGNNFAIIIALHVLEHTDNPVYVLKSIFEMLTEGGLLVIEVPDVNRAVSVRKYLHQDYFQKAHIWDFSASTIKMLVEKCGFDVYSCENYSNTFPDDKNVLLIAGKNNTVLHVLKKSKYDQHKFASQLYWNLKFKLMLGQFVDYYNRILNHS